MNAPHRITAMGLPYLDLPVRRPRSVSREQLVVLLKPFVNARLNRQRDPNSKYGAYLPRTAFVDIAYGVSIRDDADIRRIDRDGIHDAFMDHRNLIRWDDIHSVTIRGEGRAVSYVVERSAQEIAA